MPYALMLVLVASGSIASGPYRLFFWIQAAAYSIGGISLLSCRLRTKPILNPITVFITLNAAAVVALYRYSTGDIDIRWKR